ncbi:MAG: HI1506-related protein, partial [Pseudomonadales bacterium]
MSQITVNNTAHKGYRRAGLSFDTGGNVLAAQELSEKQLAQLHGDPRLVVIQSEAAPGEST